MATSAVGLSPIETNLELEELDYDIYRSVKVLWRPRNARGIFGGAVIAQSLSAASRTVPEGFNIHSLHSYFVLRGDETRPVVYHVERVRDGKSYITRTVQARQRNKAIFTLTCSYQKPESSSMTHQATMPANVPDPESLPSDEEILSEENVGKYKIPDDVRQRLLSNIEVGPTDSRRILASSSGKHPSEKRQAFWVKAKGTIVGNWHAHAMAIAYASDSYFLSTTLRVNSKTPMDVTMMASLDHSIYFHAPCRADEWLYFEMESPWSGGARGVVIGRVFSRDGTLVAECVQEGLIRMKL